MDTPYLIAHKVRGLPAFDIAIRCDDMGTLSDPSPWWIIPTFGHRAYPYWYQSLSSMIFNLEYSPDGTYEVPDEDILAQCPQDTPDFYSSDIDADIIRNLTDPEAKAAVSLLESLGLLKLKEPLKRRA